MQFVFLANQGTQLAPLARRQARARQVGTARTPTAAGQRLALLAAELADRFALLR
jgi:hypothetical protein